MPTQIVRDVQADGLPEERGGGEQSMGLKTADKKKLAALRPGFVMDFE